MGKGPTATLTGVAGRKRSRREAVRVDKGGETHENFLQRKTQFSDFQSFQTQTFN